MEPGKRVKIKIESRIALKYTGEELPSRSIIKTALRSVKKALSVPVSASPKPIFKYEDIALLKSYNKDQILIGEVRSVNTPFISSQTSQLTPEEAFIKDASGVSIEIMTSPIMDIPVRSKCLLIQKTLNQRESPTDILVYKSSSGEVILYTVKLYYINIPALRPILRESQAAGAHLSALTVKELQAKCAKRKIKYSGLRKAELVAALSK